MQHATRPEPSTKRERMNADADLEETVFAEHLRRGCHFLWSCDSEEPTQFAVYQHSFKLKSKDTKHATMQTLEILGHIPAFGYQSIPWKCTIIIFKFHEITSPTRIRRRQIDTTTMWMNDSSNHFVTTALSQVFKRKDCEVKDFRNSKSSWYFWSLNLRSYGIMNSKRRDISCISSVKQASKEIKILDPAVSQVTQGFSQLASNWLDLVTLPFGKRGKWGNLPVAAAVLARLRLRTFAIKTLSSFKSQAGLR